MPGTLNPKYATTPSSGEGGGTVDPAQVTAIVVAEIDTAKPIIISQATSQAAIDAQAKADQAKVYGSRNLPVCRCF